MYSTVESTLWVQYIESALVAISRQSRVNTTFFYSTSRTADGRFVVVHVTPESIEKLGTVENSINPAERCYRFPIAPDIGRAGRDRVAVPRQRETLKVFETGAVSRGEVSRSRSTRRTGLYNTGVSYIEATAPPNPARSRI